MKASKLIKNLEKFIEKHGDLPVYVFSNYELGDEGEMRTILHFPQHKQGFVPRGLPERFYIR